MGTDYVHTRIRATEATGAFGTSIEGHALVTLIQGDTSFALAGPVELVRALLGAALNDLDATANATKGVRADG